MPFVRSFPPLAAPDARVLLLGSMPGRASLDAVQYYAHARNAFWPILAELCGFAKGAPYEARLAGLQSRGVALWDVLQSCAREGSLDSDIDADTVQTNDFAGFLLLHPNVEAVFCNGATAFRLFDKQVRARLPARWLDLPVTQLPSTSPAHASMNFAAKLAAWRAALLPHLR